MYKLAIYNGFPYHYEMFGFIIEYAIKENHSLVIYTEKTNTFGWLDYYREFFGFNDFRPLSKFVDQAHIYDAIFLTTDEDKSFMKVLRYYDISQKVIKINHTVRERQPYGVASIDIRPYTCKPNRTWIIPSFNIVNKLPSKNNSKLRILVSATGDAKERLNWELLESLQDQTLVVVSRGIPGFFKTLKNAEFHQGLDAKDMIEVIKSCDYLFYALRPTSTFSNSAISGYVALAFGCGIPLLTDTITNQYYGFESPTIHTSEKIQDLTPNPQAVIEERKKWAGKLDQFLSNMIPDKFSKTITEINIPKIIHFMWLDNSGNKDNKFPEKHLPNIETFREYNPEFKIKIWNNGMVENLVKRYYPQYYNQYMNLPYVISRCDVARFMIVNTEGGIYSDADFYCKRNLTDMLGKEFFVEELPEHQLNGSKQLTNGFFASRPNTDFLKNWIDRMFYNFEMSKSNISDKVNFVMGTAGPKAFYEYWHDNPIGCSDPCLVVPYDNQGTLSSICRDGTRSYAYTIWNEGSGWGGNGGSFSGSFILILLIAIIVIVMIVAVVYYSKNSSNRTYKPKITV